MLQLQHHGKENLSAIVLWYDGMNAHFVPYRKTALLRLIDVYSINDSHKGSPVNGFKTLEKDGPFFLLTKALFLKY